MWTILNGVNRTLNIPPDNFEINASISDPLTTAAFTVKDPGSLINLAFGQSVMIYDESFPPYGTTPVVPTLNLVLDPLIEFTTSYWTKGGTNSSIISFGSAPNGFCQLSFSNLGTTGLANDAHIVQTATVIPAGYVTPGQKYMLSVYVQGTSSPTNIQYYFQVNWLDANQNLLSSITSGFTAPPTTQTRLSVSGIAPANAAYVQAQLGGYATSTTNSGNIVFTQVMVEPMWFPNWAMPNGTPITYPSPDANYHSPITYQMPDGTYSRVNRIFLGTISHLEAEYEGTFRTWAVDCRSTEELLENGAIINASYDATQDTDLINNVISNYFNNVLGTGAANNTQPVSTMVPGAVIDSITYADLSFREIMNQITDTTGFVYTVDPFNEVRYYPVPYTYAPFTLVVQAQPDNVTTFAPTAYKLTQDGTQLQNSIKVVGGTAQVGVQDKFSGDGSNNTFALALVPSAVTQVSIGGSVYAPTSSNKLGVKGKDTNGKSGVVALVNAKGQQVIFNTAPASGTDNVLVTYTSSAPISVLVEENSSIGKYGRKYSGKVNDTSIVSDAAARIRGEAELAKWAYPITVLEFSLSSGYSVNTYLPPGTTIPVTSAADFLTSVPFTIQTVRITSEGGGVNIFEYEAGVYRPKVRDFLRNIHKAVARNTSPSGLTVPQLTYEVVQDSTNYSDSATATIQTAGSYLYGTAIYGYSQFS